MTNFLINNQQVEIISSIGCFDNLSKLVPLKKYSKIAILTDDCLVKVYEKRIKESLDGFDFKVIIIKSGEKHKNLKTAQKVWQELFDFSFDRNSLLINFGGGMISDLGGFVAATFMRGIDFVNVPTTLLSQVDAAIGGKTAINFGPIKNNIGLFANPKYILIDPTFCESLPKREVLSGFAEILKYGIVFDKEMFEYLESKIFLSFDLKDLEQLIKKSCYLKISSIQEDFLEKGQRKLLNFGHTIGHAFESISMNTKKYLTHGEAVAIGMVIESEIACKFGLLQQKDLEKIKEIIFKNYSFNLSKKIDLESIKSKIKFDKKSINNKVNWSLPVAIGKAFYDQHIPDKIVEDSIIVFLENYKKKHVKQI